MAGGLLTPPEATRPIDPAPVTKDAPTDTMALGGGRRFEQIDDQDDEPNVTPEEQATYEEFVKNAYGVMFTEAGEAERNIVQLLDTNRTDVDEALPEEARAALGGGGFTPVQALASTTVFVCLTLARSAQRSGFDINGDVMLHAARDAIMPDLAEIAKGEGLHDYTPDELTEAFVIGTQMYLAAAEPMGLVDTAAVAEDWGQIQEAQQRGPEALRDLLLGPGPDRSAAVPEGKMTP